MDTEYDPTFSGDWTDAEHRIDRAHDLYESGMLLQALQELEAAVAINPNNKDWLFNIGLTLDSLDRYYDAIEAYSQAYELDPHDPEVLNCLGINYTRVGQHDQALKCFEELEDLAHDFEPGYCNRIITYAEMGRHEDAEAMFYLARQLQEHCPLCYYNMGNSLFARQLYDRAIWCWQQTQKLSPSHPQTDYRIALAYWAKGDHFQAKENFIAALRRRPGDVEVLLDTGILLLEMGELDGAREKLNRVLELEPRHGQAHHYLGELALNANDLPGAIEHFNQALSLNPNQPGSHYRLGECFIRQGAIVNAREHLLAETKVSPGEFEVLLDMGCLLEAVGESTEAMHCFERAIDIEPDDAHGYHNLSLSYYSAGLLEQGMELSRHVLKLQPTHLGALRSLAHAHLRQGDLDQAAQYVMLSGEVDPASPKLQALKRKIKLLRLSQRLTRPLQELRRVLTGAKVSS